MTVEDNIASEENLGRSILSSSQARPKLCFNQNACRLDPVIAKEWRQLTANRDSTANRHSATKWGAAASVNAIADRDDAAKGEPATDDAFEWTESRYDMRVALERAKELRDGGFALSCEWAASRRRRWRTATPRWRCSGVGVGYRPRDGLSLPGRGRWVLVD